MESKQNEFSMTESIVPVARPVIICTFLQNIVIDRISDAFFCPTAEALRKLQIDGQPMRRSIWHVLKVSLEPVLVVLLMMSSVTTYTLIFKGFLERIITGNGCAEVETDADMEHY